MLRKTFLAGLLLTRVWVAGAADYPYYYKLEPPAEERYGGDEAVTGGGYTRLSAKEFPGSVRILDGETLRNRGYLWLGEVLAEEADIYVEYVPGREGPAIIPRFRGSSSREVLLLIDGVPANDLVTGRADLKVIPIEAVARVEVYRGPMSYRFGDGAVAGVVNVVTLSGPREAARALISASDGTFDTERYRFNFGMTARGFDMYASGNRILTLEPNAWERNASSNVDARLGRRWGDGADVDLSYGHFAGSENVLHPWEWENVFREAPALQDNSRDHVRAAARGRWGAGDLRAEGYFAQTDVHFADGSTGRTYQARAREESAKVSYAVPHGGGGSFAVEAGGALREDVHTGEKAAVLAGSVLEEMRSGKNLYLAAGAAYDLMPGVGGALSPRLAATALLGNGFKAYGSLSGGARLPTAAELGRREEVTRELGYEAGVHYYRKGSAEAGVAYFYSRGNDVYLDGERELSGELVRRGVDVSAEGALPPWFDWGASYCLADARREGDERVGFVPEHRAFGKLGWRKSFLRDDLALRGEVRCEYTGARRTVYPAPEGGEVVEPSPYFKIPYRYELPAYWQLGAHLGIAAISFQVYCNVENINRAPDYVIAPGYSLPRKMRTYIGFNWTLYD
jgi:outer membrane receptor protein involved in Fe transport